MKYILITKSENGESTEKVYSSIRKIAQELGTTYCSCYSNFLDTVEPTRKPSKKLSLFIYIISGPIFDIHEIELIAESFGDNNYKEDYWK